MLHKRHELAVKVGVKEGMKGEVMVVKMGRGESLTGHRNAGFSSHWLGPSP
jgi:hypothetical protein